MRHGSSSAAAAAGLGLAAAAALLVYRPGPLAELRAWGVHFGLYLPAAVQVAFWIVLLAVAILPPARRLVLGAAAGIGRLIGLENDLLRRAGSFGLALACTALFWLLRSRFAFLGDNWLRL
ncbi:MAG: hypothetical protein GF355_12010 [Candidatus Eisenbacteria bacterium]|nr:hypothetical protein [Candidatus Eisenbacteria bacterium]